MTECLFSSLNKAHFITKLFAAARASYTNDMWKWFACGSGGGGGLMKERLFELDTRITLCK